MRKLITPAIYISMLFPLTAISVGIEMWARSVGILGEYHEVIDLPIFIVFSLSIIIFGVPIFWVTNLLMQRIEKRQSTALSDHIRQSSLFYLLLIFCLVSWVAGGFGTTEADGYLLLWLGISLIGIAVNYIFLFSGSRKGSVAS